MKSSRRAFTLIELLVVIAIIGILMALLFPAVSGALLQAKKAQAQNDVTQISNAINAYQTEFGAWPTNATTSTSTYPVASGLLSALQGTNTRYITFLESSPWKKGRGGTVSGIYEDPWGNTYNAVMDGAYQNSITINPCVLPGSSTAGQVTLQRTVGVFNLTTASTSSSDNTYYRNAVVSW